ncbi:hypothetical protein [Antribacter gilvus]|uniref:hypothetical protein n=1 Tax=Antribacter gilvus TaxID=2304675 RepID=UPI000F7B5C80|nr:hypothetical protein [Antribacter gilvus]
MSAPASVAVGYVSGTETADQRKALADYAAAEGIALAEVITDRADTITITQIVEATALHEAKLLLLPDDAALCLARRGIQHSLAKMGATCVVVPTGSDTEGRADA